MTRLNLPAKRSFKEEDRGKHRPIHDEKNTSQQALSRISQSYCLPCVRAILESTSRAMITGDQQGHLLIVQGNRQEHYQTN